MPKREEYSHSILIVSSSEQFTAIVKKSLRDFLMIDIRKSASMARRGILEQYFDIVVINAPLQDESGEQLALDIAQQCSASVLLVVPAEVYEDVLEHVTDQGILVLSKPMPRGRMDKAVRFLVAMQNRIRMLNKKMQAVEERLEELRIVDRAKFHLVEYRHMTEDEAHRYIGKRAMDNGVSRRRIAEEILED